MSKELTEKQIQDALEAQRKWEKMRAINKRSYERRNAWLKLMVEKAEKANITVTDAEVDKYLKDHPPKK